MATDEVALAKNKARRTRLALIGIVVGGSAVALAGLFALLAANDLTFESHYDSVAEAVDAGMDTRGWLPPFVPRDALAFFEQHDLDTNLQRGTFDGSPPRLEGCHAVDPSGISNPSVGFLSALWWPAELKGANSNGVLSQEFDVYQCDLRCDHHSISCAFYVATRKGSSRSYFWPVLATRAQ